MSDPDSYFLKALKNHWSEPWKKSPDSDGPEATKTN